MKSPTIVTKRRGHRKADYNPHGKTVIGLKEEYWNSLLPQKTIHIVFSCTWKRCLRGETIRKRERVLWSTRAGQRAGANTWSWSTMSKVLEDRRSLWEIACWWGWRIGNLPRKANHVGVSMKTKDQGTRGPGWKIIIATSSAKNQHHPLLSQPQQPKSLQLGFLFTCLQLPASNGQGLICEVSGQTWRKIISRMRRDITAWYNALWVYQ